MSHHEDSQQYAENVNVFWMLPPYVTYSDANYDPGINYIETQQGPKFSVSSKIDKIIEQNRMPQKCEKKNRNNGEKGGRTDRQIDTDRPTDRQTDRQTNELIYRLMAGRTNRHTCRPTNTRINRTKDLRTLRWTELWKE